MEIPALADLLDLQDLDLQIDRLIDRRQSLPELEQYRTANADRLSAGTELERLTGELREVELSLDKAEGELAILENRLDESETRLFAGGMNAKETEHKRLEVRSLKGQREAMEERVLVLLDQRDTASAAVSQASETANGHARTEQELEAAISAQWKEIDLELGRLEARKSEMVPAIPEDLLEMYETLRRTKEGVAVGQLEDNQCGGCHLALSSAERAEAGRTNPPRCVHCRRILVI